MFQCDLTGEDLLEHVPPESVDVAMLIFVLSAVHPEKMHLVLQNIHKVSGLEPALQGSDIPVFSLPFPPTILYCLDSRAPIRPG